MKAARKMPSQLAIRKHWAPVLWNSKGYDSEEEFMEPGQCFACGFDGVIERAHIKAKIAGGVDTVGNLHLLCKICHKDSEFLDGAKYSAWLLSRSFADRLVSTAARHGFNVWSSLSAQGDSP